MLRKEAEKVEAEAARKKDSQKKEAKEKKKKKKEEDDSSSRSKKEKKLRIRAKKPVEELFKDTGLDPSPKVRKRFLKRAQKLTRKRKKKKRGSSGSSRSSSVSADSGHAADLAGGKQRLFMEDSVIEELAEEVPGVLTSGWITAARDHLLSHRGEDPEEESGRVPSLATKFIKLNVHGKMSPPMQREAGTLSKMIDQLLAGRVAEACDVGVQRLKSLEAVASGVHYSIANRMELLPQEKTLAASSAETLEAAKQVSQEEKLLQKTTKPPQRPWENREGPKGGGKNNKGKSDKGKAKEGKGTER